MNIIYIHHAHRKREFPRSQDEDITELGERDANLTAELLKASNLKIDEIYTSEFYRCTKTANIINKYLNAKIIIEPRFNEHGSREGESWLDTQLRIREALMDIIKSHNNEDNIVCVTSGINVVAFIGLYYGIEPANNLPIIGVPSCSPLSFQFDKDKYAPWH